MLDKILNYCFYVSKQPVLLKDLLVANVQHNERMHVDATKLGFRLKLRHAYLVYILLISIFAIPLAAIAHAMFAKIDTHASIVASITFTAIIFICFNFFRVWLKEQMTRKAIQNAWKNHFPIFPYEEYRFKIEKIFHQAMKDEIQKKDLEKYILDRLLQE